ncbi:Hypothetical predicted protein [Lecanosticta acicola]|uniref:Uncharacterized protein n=1 Tax=Lecanosticta acicola TaxID=111012 RepID=A0AAI8Z4T0_9PEZI|nr:Hypothetical predicted protein [Lecanosticta acicola]
MASLTIGTRSPTGGPWQNRKTESHKMPLSKPLSRSNVFFKAVADILTAAGPARLTVPALQGYTSARSDDEWRPKSYLSTITRARLQVLREAATSTRSEGSSVAGEGGERSETAELGEVHNGGIVIQVGKEAQRGDGAIKLSVHTIDVSCCF